jgi:uncharacterized protein with PQ loop repeat
MVENVIFGLLVVALLAVAAFVAYQVINRSNDIEKTIEAMKPIQLAKWLLLLLGAAFVFMAIIFIRYFTHFYGHLSNSKTDWGTFGDFIGGTLNPILSFLSLIALLTTIVLQSKELELTRKELTLTRDELERSASAQEETKKILDKQYETLTRQQFETTFFSLLDQHNKALDYLNRPGVDSNVTKLDLIVKSAFLPQIIQVSTVKSSIESKNYICGHYFRILYQVLKFIATNSPGNKVGPKFELHKVQFEEVTNDEKMYSGIVRSVLSDPITHLLAAYCFCADENDPRWDYRLLIERYELLKYMPVEIQGRDSSIFKKLKNCYNPSAFGIPAFTPTDKL